MPYQNLISRAYDSLYLNHDFRQALCSTASDSLFHSIGGPEPHKTILTENEFIQNLVRLRSQAACI